MRGLLPAFFPRVISALLMMSFGIGCTIPQNHSSRGTHDRAYITYWPPPKGDKELRLAVKDIIDMKGVVTTGGSEYRAKNSAPVTKDADCLRIARQRHVRIVGKTNLSELALRGSGMNDYFGTPRNPLKHELIPGGSSSGSAVAIADGTADVAFGTDTCGSIRVPAACCGIVGLKTTFGLVSTKGVLPISSHLDTVGPLGKDVNHVVMGMDLLQEGFAAKYRAAVAAKPLAKQITVGRFYLDGTNSAIDKAIDDALEATGFHVFDLGGQFGTKWAEAESDGQLLAREGAWHHDEQYMFKSGVQPVTSTIIWTGKIVPRDKYEAALKDQVEFRERLAQTFKRVDFIIVPTLQSMPLKKPFLGSNGIFELRVLGMQNTEPMNMVGNPALALPIPIKGKNLPVTSLQVVGPNNSEAQILNVGRLIEAAVHVH